MASVNHSAGSWTTYGSGAVDWDGGASALSSNNSVYAHTIAQVSAGNKTLRAYNFGLSGIPGSAIIVGVQVDLYGYAATASQTYETGLHLFSGTAGTAADQIGSNKGRGSGSKWLSSNGLIASFGGSADLWGATLTPAIVQSSNFGVDLDVKATVNDDCYVDYILITVTYLPSAVATLAAVELGDAVTLSALAKVATSWAATEVGDIISAAASVAASCSLAIVEPGDAFASVSTSAVVAGITASEIADVFAATGRRFIPIYAGRSATIVEKASPTVTLIEKAAARAEI